jgi:tetratricopeptide (TPR) repeat protein
MAGRPPGARPLLLFVANGEIAKAGHLYSVLRPNTLDKSSAGILLDRIQKVIKLHDKGRYHEAIKIYRDILADYPGSAWASYELFFSTLFRDKLMPPSSQADLDQRWGAASAEIYKLDPLYDVQMTGSRGKDFGSMIDRLTLRSMEEKPPADPIQVFATKAEIALHLERYGEAALIYWQLLFRKGDVHVQLIMDKTPRTLTAEQLIARYLYCLEQLGAPAWKSQFKGDFAEALKQLDAELAAYRKQ